MKSKIKKSASNTQFSPFQLDILKWTEALRSGEYNQCQNQLQFGDSFCCLGVACDIFITENANLNDRGQLKGCYPMEQPNAPQWLKDINKDFDDLTKDEAGVGFRIETMNDYEKMTFDEIADCLEAVYIHEVLK